MDASSSSYQAAYSNAFYSQTTNISPSSKTVDTRSLAEQIASSKLVLRDRFEDPLPMTSYKAPRYLDSKIFHSGIPENEASAFQKTVACLVLPALKINREILTRSRIEFLKGPVIADRVCIQTVDDVHLDTFQIFNLDQVDLPSEEQKWLLFFNGNAVPFEQNLKTLETLSNDLGVNVFTGNYRGVGFSHGFPQGQKDLVLDGEAMVHYLLDKGVLPRNILLHGWSLGGAVALKVASHHPINLCHDRSFSKIENVLENMLPPGISTLASGYVTFSPWSFGDLTKDYLSLKGNKFIIYSPEDGIIRPQASLLNAFVKNSQTSIIIKDLNCPGIKGSHSTQSNLLSWFMDIPNEYQQYMHSVPITQCGENYEEYIRLAKKALNFS